MKQIADAVKRSRKATMKFLRHQKEEGIVPLMLQKIRVETAGQVSQYCTITDEEILTTDQDERLRLARYSMRCGWEKALLLRVFINETIHSLFRI
uniref:Transposase n=1 Tax=Heterorhabditis bacteriophora TaxID=37862 RepID=A0A1I7WNP4_HETBA